MAGLNHGGMLDAGLLQQVQYDIDALERVAGLRLSEGDRKRLTEVQHQAMRWTFLGSGMTHPRFLESVGNLYSIRRARLEEVAPMFC